jgi:antitoxin (DNA-binding transcriptional repressor) of toxin-antitoxin stability system
LRGTSYPGKAAFETIFTLKRLHPHPIGETNEMRPRCIEKALREADVRRTVSDMKVLTMRDLNRKTASVLDAVERGEAFELRRNGRAIWYLTRTPPTPQRKPDWKTHFDWLRQKAAKKDIEALAEFEQERRRQAAREHDLGNLQ